MLDTLSLSELIDVPDQARDDRPTYWYEGICPRHGDRLRLPRTRFVEAIACGLMRQLAVQERFNREGKMYGVLLVETPAGEQRVLKAFSGLLQGEYWVEGWVPPLPGRDQIVLEESLTLQQLEAMKQELIRLHHLPERQQYLDLCQEFDHRWQQLKFDQAQYQQQRQLQRQVLAVTLSGEALSEALESLDRQSRQEGMKRRRFKQERQQKVQPLKHRIEQADAQIRQIKQQRKVLSRQLQAQMYRAYCLTNFMGEVLSLQQLMPGKMLPTGTGDCCAPKLLHFAATHGLRPVAMAEFWWGEAKGDKQPGQFYGACTDRCQPLMGFLLSGLSQFSEVGCSAPLPLSILYEDEWLVAIDKPAGLLSVPGRHRDRQDSVLNRLRCRSDGTAWMAVHRLDQDTSGILLVARDRLTHRHLSSQFEQRQVHKVYEAILVGSVEPDQGQIELPLWADPDDRPRQKVDWLRGKPGLSRFWVLERTQSQTRVRFVPETGRTHQLRVHAADPQGLNAPILGDRLYGHPDGGSEAKRLYLHAQSISLQHPHSGQPLNLQTETPF